MPSWLYGVINKDLATSYFGDVSSGDCHGEFIVYERKAEDQGDYVLGVVYKTKMTFHLIAKSNGQMKCGKNTFDVATIEELVSKLSEDNVAGWPVKLTKPPTGAPNTSSSPSSGGGNNSWLHGEISREESEEMVTNKGKDGAYLVRTRAGEEHNYVLCVRYKGRPTHHLITRNAENIFTVNKKSYGDAATVEELISTLQQPDVIGWPVPLAYPCEVGGGGGGGDDGDDDAGAEDARVAEARAAKEKEKAAADRAAKQKKEEDARARAAESERKREQQQQQQQQQQEEEKTAREAAEQRKQEEVAANEEQRRAQEAAEKAKQQEADVEKQRLEALEGEKKKEVEKDHSTQHAQAQARPETTPVIVAVTAPVVVSGGDTPVMVTPTSTHDVGIAIPTTTNTPQHPDVELLSLRAAQQSNEYNRQMALSAVEKANQNKDIALHHFNAEQQLEQQRQLDFLIQQQRLQLEKQLMEYNKMSTSLQQETQADNSRKNSAIEIMERQSVDMQDTDKTDLRSVPRGRSSREFDNQTHVSMTMSMTSSTPSKRGRRRSKEDDSTTAFRVKQAQARLAQQEAELTLATKQPRRLSQQAVQASHELSDLAPTSKVLDTNGVWVTRGGILTGDGKLAA